MYRRFCVLFASIALTFVALDNSASAQIVVTNNFDTGDTFNLSSGKNATGTPFGKMLRFSQSAPKASTCILLRLRCQRMVQVGHFHCIG